MTNAGADFPAPRRATQSRRTYVRGAPALAKTGFPGGRGHAPVSREGRTRRVGTQVSQSVREQRGDGHVAGDVAGQIRRAYLLALGRAPTAKESAALVGYAGRHGLVNVCRVLLNCNEFMFVP